jgi:hypothetical protein
MNQTPKTLTIKHKGWHEVTLTGDLMTGDTFKIKDWIKQYLNGKWDSNRKGWIVDLDKVARYSNESGDTLMVR